MFTEIWRGQICCVSALRQIGKTVSKGKSFTTLEWINDVEVKHKLPDLIAV